MKDVQPGWGHLYNAGDLFLDGNKLVDEIAWIIRWTMRTMWGHLNYLGNQKYTVSRTYIKEHYTVSDRRADAAYESWQKTRIWASR